MTWYRKDDNVEDMENLDVTADMEEMDVVIGRPSAEDTDTIVEPVEEKKEKKKKKKKASKKKTSKKTSKKKDKPVFVEPVVVVEKPVIKKCKKCKRPAADNGKGFCKLCGHKL